MGCPAHAVWERGSAFTGTDPQDEDRQTDRQRADGETVDHKQLSAAVLKPRSFAMRNILIPVSEFLHL